MTTVLFAGGGTGGHLMPALAIAEAMVRLEPRVQPFFVGAERGVESQVLPARPWRHVLLPLEPIYRRQWWKNARLPLSLWRSLRGVARVVDRVRPRLAVGTGGYAAGPALWAAARRGVPIVLQEQNVYPGFATRRLAGRAAQIHLGFPEARRYLAPGPRTQVFDTGNPIARPPAPGERISRADAKTRLGFDPARPVVLVTGASQGSVALNRAVAEALRSSSWPRGVQLHWQTGAGSFGEFAPVASALPGSDCRVAGFIDPMSEAWASSDLVVARGGASTFAEVAAWGLPSILVPLPTSAANHQLVNARALDAAGAAVLLEQHNLTGASLSHAVGGLLGSPARMADLARAASLRARPGAAEQIARESLQLLDLA